MRRILEAGMEPALPLVVACACLAGGASPSTAATSDGEFDWRVELDALLTSSRGFDRVTGSLVVRDAGSLPVTESSQPLYLDLDGDITGRLELTRLGGRWGWGLSGWWYDGADSDLRLQELQSDSAAGVGVTLYTEALVPSIAAPDKGVGSLNYVGTTHFQAGSLQLQAVRRAGGGDSPLELRAGVRLGKVHETRVEILDRFVGAGWDRFSLDSDMTGELMIGPAVGLRGQARAGRHRFSGWADLSVLIGNVDYSARYEERVDDVPQLRSDLRLEQDTAIPGLELGLRWTYDVSTRWALGLAAFSSIWWNVPESPLAASPAGPARFDEATLAVSGAGIAAAWTDRPRAD